MNIYKKYCPNVFVAACEERHEKGELIKVTSKWGKENEHIVHNFVGRSGKLFCYSITRADGFDNQDRAKKKMDALNKYADNAEKRGAQWREKSDEGKDFLALAEPIKIGHHSEKRHRALIERNWTRMSNAMDEFKKADAYRERLSYWEALSGKIDLSMPESIDFFEEQLHEAVSYHQGLKDGSIPREHAYSLAYAGKRVKELKEKHETAVKLWGGEGVKSNQTP